MPDGSAHEEAWLVRVLINICRDRWRQVAVRRFHQPSLDLAPPSTHPESALIARSLVWQALDQLPPRRRAILILYELEGTQIPAIARLESELRAATQRLAEAKAAQAGEYVRQVEGEERSREGLAGPKFGDRSIMNTSFTMDLGETVVVGTSRLSGNSKALIALLTAVPSEVGAVGTRRRYRQVTRSQFPNRSHPATDAHR